LNTKIIFLDIDGVLNAPNYWRFWWWNLLNRMGFKTELADDTSIERRFVRRLNWIVRRANAHIVISSAWRHRFPDWMQWLHLFTSMGFPAVGNAVIGTTVSHAPSVKRGAEIQGWLDRPEKRPECRRIPEPISAYVILDDDSDMTPQQKSGHFVQTNPYKGLTRKDCRRALKILRRNEA